MAPSRFYPPPSSLISRPLEVQSLWMLVAAFLFAAMAVLVKFASEAHSLAEIIFWRGAVGIVVVAMITRWQGVSIRTGKPWLHLSRGAAGLASLGLYYYTIAELPVGTAFTLQYTSPIWVAVLGTIAFRDRAHWQLPAAIALGFAGAVMVLQPTFSADQALTGLLGLLGALLSGAAYINVRKLALEGEPESRIVFYFALFMMLGAAIWIVADQRMLFELRGLAFMLGAGCLATLGQLALTRAFSRGKSILAATLSYAGVAFAVLFGWLFWDETLPLGGAAGIALIVASGVLATFATVRQPPPGRSGTPGTA